MYAAAYSTVDFKCLLVSPVVNCVNPNIISLFMRTSFSSGVLSWKYTFAMASNSFMTNPSGVFGWHVSEANCCVKQTLVGSGIVSLSKNLARSTGSRLSECP